MFQSCASEVITFGTSVYNKTSIPNNPSGISFLLAEMCKTAASNIPCSRLTVNIPESNR